MKNGGKRAAGFMSGKHSAAAFQNAVVADRDVRVYSTEALERDPAVTGHVKATLYVITTTPATDVIAKSVGVYPIGSPYNIRSHILRRDGPPDVPGSTEIELGAISNLFKKGHRVRLEVSVGNRARSDRNPNPGGLARAETAPVAATQSIQHSPGRAARRALPVIRAEKQHFFIAMNGRIP